MTGETITLDGLARLEDLLRESTRTVQRVHIEATLGIITTAEAAAMINHLVETINKATE